MKNVVYRIVSWTVVLSVVGFSLASSGCTRPQAEFEYRIYGGFSPYGSNLSIAATGDVVYSEAYFGDPLFEVTGSIDAARHRALYDLFLANGFNGFEDSYPREPWEPTDLPNGEITFLDHRLGTSKTVSFYMFQGDRPEGLWEIKGELAVVIEEIEAANLFTYELEPGSRIYGASCPDCDDFNDEELSGNFTLVEVPSPSSVGTTFRILWLTFRSSTYLYHLGNDWGEFSRVEVTSDPAGATMTAYLYVNEYEEWFEGEGTFVAGAPLPESFSFSDVSCGWVAMDLTATRAAVAP